MDEALKEYYGFNSKKKTKKTGKKILYRRLIMLSKKQFRLANYPCLVVALINGHYNIKTVITRLNRL